MADGVRDHCIGEPGHDIGRHGFPVLPLQPDEETAIREAPGEGELVDRGILLVKAGELLGVVLDDRGKDAAESAERLIAVARDRPPQAFAVLDEPDPSPLVEVTVPISDQHVDEPRAEVGAGVDLLVAAFLQPDQ